MNPVANYIWNRPRLYNALCALWSLAVIALVVGGVAMLAYSGRPTC